MLVLRAAAPRLPGAGHDAPGIARQHGVRIVGRAVVDHDDQPASPVRPRALSIARHEAPVIEGGDDDRDQVDMHRRRATQ